jgi:phosphohistidine phosphatase
VPELILFRHAKSDWGTGFASDRDRPLARRGEKAARAMGRALTLAKKVPDLVISSPAVRAETTARLAAQAGEWPARIDLDERLYGASPVEVALVAADADAEGVMRLMLVGHEPTWSETASLLVGGASIRVVTAAAVCLEVPSLRALTPGRATLQWMLTPRLFTDGDFDLG